MNRLHRLSSAVLLGVAAFGMTTILSSTAFAGKTEPIDPDCTCEPAFKLGRFVCVLVACVETAPKEFACTYACPNT